MPAAMVAMAMAMKGAVAEQCCADFQQLWLCSSMLAAGLVCYFLFNRPLAGGRVSTLNSFLAEKTCVLVLF